MDDQFIYRESRFAPRPARYAASDLTEARFESLATPASVEELLLLQEEYLTDHFLRDCKLYENRVYREVVVPYAVNAVEAVNGTRNARERYVIRRWIYTLLREKDLDIPTDNIQCPCRREADNHRDYQWCISKLVRVLELMYEDVLEFRRYKSQQREE